MRRVGRVVAMGLAAGWMGLPAHGQQAAAKSTTAGVHVEVLTDTGGVNLSLYMRGVVAGLRSHWQAGLPAGSKVSEETVLSLAIAADGELAGLNVEHPAGDEALDKAAWSAAKETHFAPLPAGLKETPLKLRVSFAAD